MVMSIELQKVVLDKFLESKGISSDLVDTKALIDSSLSLSENKSLLEENLNIEDDLCKQQIKEMEQQTKEFNFSEARRVVSPENESVLASLFQKNRVVGIVGDRNVGKSSLVLQDLLKMKQNYPDLPVFCIGVEPSLHSFLESKGIFALYSTQDLLDLRIRNAVIFIDEFASLFSVQSRDKETEKVGRFFNRLAHMNCFVVLASAQSGFFNKFITGLISAYLVCKISFDALVNGTALKRNVIALETTSDYRLDLDIGEYYILNDSITKFKKFNYCPEVDAKKENTNPFCERKGEDKL